MNWTDIGSDIARAAPVLGTLIGGPAGGALGALVASALGTPNDPAAVQQALATNPDAAVKLRQIEADQSVALQKLLTDQAANAIAADTARIQAVNATMQAESKSDHWPTYSWRPFIGFLFGIMTAAVYFVLPLLHEPVPSIPAEVWMAYGAVMGVASWYRGKMQADPNIPTDNRG